MGDTQPPLWQGCSHARGGMLWQHMAVFVRQDAEETEVASLWQAFSIETSTASYAELAAAMGGFAASSILGRRGLGPVYCGEWSGQAVAIKLLDQVLSVSLALNVICTAQDMFIAGRPRPRSRVCGRCCGR